MSDRERFPVYVIETDDFDGRLRRRASFTPLGESVKHHVHQPTGLVERDELDGGFAGTLTAPNGSQLVKLQDGQTVIRLPNGWTFSADQAIETARVKDRAQACGLGWSRAPGDEAGTTTETEPRQLSPELQRTIDRAETEAMLEAERTPLAAPLPVRNPGGRCPECGYTHGHRMDCCFF